MTIAIVDTSHAAAVNLQAPLAFEDDKRHRGRQIYRLLTGNDPAEAVIDDDFNFDRHVIASILAVSAMEHGVLAERAGLSTVELIALLAQLFPAAAIDSTWLPINGAAPAPDDDEIAMVRDLLTAQRSTDGDVSRWLAAMVARRAMEPNHLWEDLGLRERSELSRLLMRHFAPLASRNTRNMRWKRFFYRMLCEDDGFVMCTTPVCTQCNDFALCFGEESGESRMAERRREVALQEAASAAM
ncbi:putative nitrogen fixation protein nifQ [Bradyrhizobium sp. ORS 285]|uniref:nitrogen fixation protein NifQ n=1 Tax=Bradyrhizobium sp. ORS 285 TaxID=115808 RepID=UPI0002407277|nr:nitrogen fixation protein NifQ [Bradyrhizobium sp. ORS 285]CCD84360.1 putative nitrogen fixation protein nifQ [Bradyrhizobium sp. ORS 285]SMX57003.1 putative nitrogen fixation protein nifQ [Bradyrhizobium sp. ORS 285]